MLDPSRPSSLHLYQSGHRLISAAFGVEFCFRSSRPTSGGLQTHPPPPTPKKKNPCRFFLETKPGRGRVRSGQGLLRTSLGPTDAGGPARSSPPRAPSNSTTCPSREAAAAAAPPRFIKACRRAVLASQTICAECFRVGEQLRRYVSGTRAVEWGGGGESSWDDCGVSSPGGGRRTNSSLLQKPAPRINRTCSVRNCLALREGRVEFRFLPESSSAS